MILKINSQSKDTSYDIYIERGILDSVEKYINLDRKVLIITDDNIPQEYIDKVTSKSKISYVFTIKAGEASKNFDNLQNILEFMLKKKFTRTDTVVAIGGGVVGDLSGLVASLYMRGVDFYNIPTTLLSQVDSSIGGKTAIDFCNIKNCIGQFKFPKAVVIDSNTLKTLSQRQIHTGLVESLKMAVTSDRHLFELIKKSKNLEEDVDEIIISSLRIKASIVSVDPYETGLRKVLNFGHTIGHAIESLSQGELFHGECVGIGMLYMCSNDIKKDLVKILKKYNLPYDCDFSKGSNYDIDKIIDMIKVDKKASSDKINIVYTDQISTFEFRKIDIEDIRKILQG